MLVGHYDAALRERGFQEVSLTPYAPPVPPAFWWFVRRCDWSYPLYLAAERHDPARYGYSVHTFCSKP